MTGRSGSHSARTAGRACTEAVLQATIQASGRRAAAALEPAHARRVGAVVVAGREGADMLAEGLPSLLAQVNPGDAEIFLVDGGSTDGTGALARELSVQFGGLPLTVSSPGEPEPGWTGKLWALRH